MVLNVVIRFLLFFILAVSYMGSALAFDFKEGEWELSVKTTISGMPTGFPLTKYRQCLSIANPVPTAFLNARSCDVMELKKLHRALTYKINCFTENGTVISEGKVRFSTVKLKGTAKSDLNGVTGRNSILRYKFTGKYLGSCH